MPPAAPQWPAAGCSGECRPSPDRRLPIGPSIWPRAAPVKASASPSATENHLEHELAAGIGEEQQRGSRNDPTERGASAPAVAMASDEQRPEYEPSKQRKHDFVRELQRPAEQLLGEQGAT